MIRKKIIVDSVIAQDMFLSEYLMEIYPNAKYEVLYAAIIRKDISLNGKFLEDDVFIRNGDIIDFKLFFFQLGILPVLDIIYEDENFLAIEKMPGIPSFDEERTGEANVYDMALEYLIEKGECNIEALIVPYLCYSIPKYAGGIVLIAKHEQFFEFVDNGVKQKNVQFTYEALVAGKVKKRIDEVKHYMNNKYRVYKNVNPKASAIITRYKQLRQYHRCTRVEITPISMRKNQAYVHMAYLGNPVLGDDTFGDRKLNKKLFLDYENIWLKKVEFSVGKFADYFYLDGLCLKMEKVYYPRILLKL